MIGAPQRTARGPSGTALVWVSGLVSTFIPAPCRMTHTNHNSSIWIFLFRAWTSVLPLHPQLLKMTSHYGVTCIRIQTAFPAMKNHRFTFKLCQIQQFEKLCYYYYCFIIRQYFRFLSALSRRTPRTYLQLSVVAMRSPCSQKKKSQYCDVTKSLSAAQKHTFSRLVDYCRYHCV